MSDHENLIRVANNYDNNILLFLKVQTGPGPNQSCHLLVRVSADESEIQLILYIPDQGLLIDLPPIHLFHPHPVSF